MVFGCFSFCGQAWVVMEEEEQHMNWRMSAGAEETDPFLFNDDSHEDFLFTSAHFHFHNGFRPKQPPLFHSRWLLDLASPTIFAPTRVGNNFLLSFQTEPGKTFMAQYIDSLAALNWQNLPGVAGDGITKTVTNPAPNVTRRFYRLLKQ